MNMTIESERCLDGIFVRDVRPTASGGPNTPLLMVHGAMHGAWAWEPWLTMLASAGWHCSALSLRNHPGSSPVPLDEYLRLSAMDYVDDILTVVESMPRPPVLIGHSMGTILCQKAAELANVAGLILVCGIGPGQLGKLRDPLPIDQTVMRPIEDVRRFFFGNIDDEALAEYFKRLVPESPSVINHCNGGELTIERERISCPVLILGGEQDAIPLHSPKSIAKFYDADLLMIPSGSHNFFLEDSSFSAAIRVNEWLLTNVDEPALPQPVKSLPP